MSSSKVEPMSLQEVRLPDIGDFRDVPIIEVLVRPGDRVEADGAIITLETDKATLEVPSPASGMVAEVRVKVGDRISAGDLILFLEPAATGAPVPAPEEPGAPAAVTVMVGSGDSSSSHSDEECEVLVLGAGPGGYSAAFRAADLGKRVVLVERFPKLGGVCLNVGCIPSKALLHLAGVMDAAAGLASHGISFGAPQIDLPRIRSWKDQVVRRLTDGLSGMAGGRGVSVVRGVGRFLDSHRVEVRTTDGPGKETNGESRIIRFEQAIIAAGSSAVRLPFLPNDPRVMDSTAALELPEVDSLLVVGGGIIGLELATVYSTLGARIDVVELTDRLMTGADADLVRVWKKHNAHRFDRIMMETRAVSAEARDDGIWVRFEGPAAPAEAQRYDAVLEAVGRIPNGREIAADRAGVQVSDRGFIPVDRQMRTNVSHIFAIGDITAPPMLAHKAVHEGHVAAEAAAGGKSYFDATVIPSVAYTDPEVAWVGLTEEAAREQGREVETARFPWTASGRAIANGRDEGLTKLVFDRSTGRIVGGAIVGTNAGDLIGEIGLAIEMGADAVDIARTIHAHPTLGESIGLAAEVHEGTCTDLPPRRSAQRV